MQGQEFLTFGKWMGVPIEWTVLERKGARMLLLSRYILDAHIFHPDCIYTSWERSAVREWLHTVFLHEAFSEAERARILPAEHTTPPSPGMPSYGSETTQDSVFLLTSGEAARYLPSPAARITPAEPTARRESPDLRDFTALLPYYPGVQGCWWWLRDPGVEPNQMHIVWSDGTFASTGHYVNYERGIRPALWIKS